MRIFLLLLLPSILNAAEIPDFYKSLIGEWKPKEDCEMKTGDKVEKLAYSNLKIKSVKKKGNKEIEVHYIDSANSKDETKAIVSYDSKFSKVNAMEGGNLMENTQVARTTGKALLVGTINKWLKKDKMGLYFTVLTLNKDGYLDLKRTGITVEDFKEEMPELPTVAWQMHCELVKK